jgi:hypothetical protein
VKFRVVAGKIRTANPLRIAFVFVLKQTLNMETVHFVSTSDKYLKTYGGDEQTTHVGLRVKCLLACPISNFMTIHSEVFGSSIYTRASFHRHNTLSFLKRDSEGTTSAP